MADFDNLPCHDESGNVHVVVEAPRGSLVKLRYDPKLKAFLFRRPLLLGVAYPYDWGFVHQRNSVALIEQSNGVRDKLAQRTQVVAAVVRGQKTAIRSMPWCSSMPPTWPGVVIPSIPIGIVRLTQKEPGKKQRVRNDRIIAVPSEDKRYKHVDDLTTRVRAELEEFFVTASRMAGKKVRVEGWDGPSAARASVKKAAERYLLRGSET